MRVRLFLRRNVVVFTPFRSRLREQAMRGLWMRSNHKGLLYILSGRDREVVRGVAKPANRIIDEELIFLRGTETHQTQQMCCFRD